jgi:hypothetical protein
MICDISECEDRKILFDVGGVENLKCGSYENARILG